MNKQGKNAERRKQQRLERLGTNNPICPGCGETRWYCFEVHHLAGRKYDGGSAPVCNNCHAEQSERQKDHPEQMSEPPHRLECIGHYLIGLADFLESIVRKLRELGHELIEAARQALKTTTECPQREA
jgi:hypothetical protein